MKYDIVIIGAGIYGLYAASLDIYKNKRVLVIEIDKESTSRASYINQARLHNGYHYPRSFETANDVKKYYQKFKSDFSFAINDTFESIYAISKNDSLTSAKDFENFCNKLDIKCQKIDSNIYFNPNMVEDAFLTEEAVFDINLIKDFLLIKIKKQNNVDIFYESYITKVDIKNSDYILKLNNDREVITSLVINTTYASINQINKLFNIDMFPIKYELCEMILGTPSDELRNKAITIMDGKFFSTMPFGKTEYQSLSAVHFTPHKTCYEDLPKFDCQKKCQNCNSNKLANCNNCPYRPKSSQKQMIDLFNKYLKNNYKFNYKESLYTIKPILLEAEDDDKRPTIIKKFHQKPDYIACLSGKVSTIYIMEEFLRKENAK